MTEDREWRVTSDLDFEEWNKIDLSWTEKGGLSVYKNDRFQEEMQLPQFMRRVSWRIY